VIDIFFGLSAQEWAEVIRNYVITGVSIFTVWIAYRGLTNWQNQEVWKEDRALAKLVLVRVYKIRQAIDSCRSPFMSEAEKSAAYNGEDYDWRDKQKMRLAKQSAYTMRYHKIMMAFTELEPLELESKVVWGAELSNLIIKLYQLILNLKYALEDSHIFNENVSYLNSQIENDADRKEDKDNRRIISKRSEDDDFSKEVNSIIEEINTLLSKYLGRNP
jgi:hypothetical protein